MSRRELRVVSYDIRIENRKEQVAAVVRERVSLDDLPTFLGGAFSEVAAALAEQNLYPSGPPFGQYAFVDGGFDVAAGFPASGAVTSTGRVEAMVLPGGPIATTLHVGSYDKVSAAYLAITEWLTGSRLVVAGDPWECYLDDPEVEAPRTLVCFPCREVIEP